MVDVVHRMDRRYGCFTTAGPNPSSAGRRLDAVRVAGGLSRMEQSLAQSCSWPCGLIGPIRLSCLGLLEGRHGIGISVALQK